MASENGVVLFSPKGEHQNQNATQPTLDQGWKEARRSKAFSMLKQSVDGTVSGTVQIAAVSQSVNPVKVLQRMYTFHVCTAEQLSKNGRAIRLLFTIINRTSYYSRPVMHQTTATKIALLQ